MVKNLRAMLLILALLPAGRPWASEAEALAALWVTGTAVPPRDVQIWDTAQLTQMFRRQDPRKDLPPGWVHPGFTRVNFRTEIGKMDLHWAPTQGGKISVWLKRLEVDFSIKTFDVQISKQYPFGSCGYQVIHRHEYQHVQFTRKAWEDSKGRLRGEMARTLKLPLRSNPLTVTTIDQAGEAIESQVEDFLKGFVDRAMAENHAANAVIDTLENYEREWKPCQRP